MRSENFFSFPLELFQAIPVLGQKHGLCSIRLIFPLFHQVGVDASIIIIWEKR